MRKYRSFRDDEQIGKKLDSIPKNEKSTVIRMALRQYFGITAKEYEVLRFEIGKPFSERCGRRQVKNEAAPGNKN